jgi:hypothetical protein
MKKITFFVFTAMLLTVAMRVSAQNAETTMKPIMQDAMIYVDTIEAHNYEVVRMEFDLVSKTKNKETFRQMSTDYTYSVWVFGDFRFDDIDVAIYQDMNGSWKQVAKDNSAESNALVTFKPEVDGMYKIEVIAYKFKPDYSIGHYGLIIFHE